MNPACRLPVHREDDIRAHQRTQSTTGAIAFGIRRFHGPISTGIESVATHAEDPSWTCRHAQFATFAPVYIDDHRTLDHACHLLGTAITGLLRLSSSPDGHERGPAARGRRKAEAKYSQKAGSRLNRHLCRDDPVYLLPPQAKITPAFRRAGVASFTSDRPAFHAAADSRSRTRIRKSSRSVSVTMPMSCPSDTTGRPPIL